MYKNKTYIHCNRKLSYRDIIYLRNLTEHNTESKHVSHTETLCYGVNTYRQRSDQVSPWNTFVDDLISVLALEWRNTREETSRATINEINELMKLYHIMKICAFGKYSWWTWWQQRILNKMGQGQQNNFFDAPHIISISTTNLHYTLFT